MEKIGEIIKSNGSQSLSKDTTAMTQGLSKNSLVWALQLRAMAQNMRQDLAPGQLTYWKQEMDQYTDAEISDALALYKGEFFPSTKNIQDIMERRREAKSEEAKRGQWDKWKERDAQGQRATKEEIAAMVQGCKETWNRLEREGRLVRSGGVSAKTTGNVGPVSQIVTATATTATGLSDRAGTERRSGGESVQEARTVAPNDASSVPLHDQWAGEEVGE